MKITYWISKFLTTCLHPNAISKRIEVGHPARSQLKDLSQIFKMVMDFAMFFSLLGCETLTNKLLAFLFCHSYDVSINELQEWRQTSFLLLHDNEFLCDSYCPPKANQVHAFWANNFGLSCKSKLLPWKDWGKAMWMDSGLYLNDI